MADIYQTYKGKSIFFTGVTGFVGKVFLFKLLKEFGADMDTIFVLCRPKKNVAMKERLEKEVLSSACFHPLIKDIGEAEWKRRTAKIVPVAGDIMFNRLGLSEADYETICSKVHFIVHLAATVDFQEKLNVSINMNCLGTIRVLSLAQRCPKLEAFVHTSTCYVNYPRYGGSPIMEQVYPVDFDPESMVKFIMTLADQQIPVETKRLLKRYNFANTYTFTKNLTEHIILKRKGSVPLAIVRPAIIGAAWREPYNGWVDALTAAGGLFLTVGLGITRELVGSMEAVADVVPVDRVVNVLLKVVHKTSVQHRISLETVPRPALKDAAAKGVAVAATTTKGGAGGAVTPVDALATIGNQNLAKADGDSSASDPGVGVGVPALIYHSCTSSSMNPLRWSAIRESLLPYWANLKHPKAVGPPTIRFHPTMLQFEVSFFLRQRLPLMAAQAINSIPGLRNAKKEEMFKRYEKALWRTRDLNNQFHPFTINEWRFEQQNLETLDESLAPSNRAAFSHDALDINWHHYGIAYSWGMIRFIMKEDREQPKMPPSGSELVMKAFM